MDVCEYCEERHDAYVEYTYGEKHTCSSCREAWYDVEQRNGWRDIQPILCDSCVARDEESSPTVAATTEELCDALNYPSNTDTQ